MILFIILIIVAVLIVYSSCVTASESDKRIEKENVHIYHIFNDNDTYKACEIIKEKRIKKKYSQRYLANLCDVNQNYIYRLENHKIKHIKPDVLINICNALNLDKTYILSLTGYYQLVNSLRK